MKKTNDSIHNIIWNIHLKMGKREIAINKLKNKPNSIEA